MTNPTPKASWRRDTEGIYRVFIPGTILYDGTVVEVESRSGGTKLVTLTGTHSKVAGGHLYWYKPVSETVVQTVVAIGVAPVAPVSTGSEVSVEELDAALGF